jgi:molybdopterin/thiamine biosynthesis adenylyltransferase
VLDETQIRRYARHILLPEIGGRGQERLLAATVVVELGEDRAAEVAALAYLAAAGVGRLIVRGGDGAIGVDEARTGILYGAADVGRPRGAAVAARVARLNPDVVVVSNHDPLTDGPAALSLGAAPLPHAASVEEALITGGRAAARLVARIAESV